MNRIFARIAALLAFIIGAMAVVAGGRVLLGTDPGYFVINWLPVFNFVVGVLTVLVTAPLIWRGSRYALPAALATFGAHAVVMLILLTASRNAVATESIVAMTVRLAVWLVILGLMFLQGRKDRQLTPA